jgi:hypothetical protein
VQERYLEELAKGHAPAVAAKRAGTSRPSVYRWRKEDYQCSFCTIINVQGRKSRHRSPTDKTGYDPIKDVSGKVIWIWYVGYEK